MTLVESSQGGNTTAEKMKYKGKTYYLCDKQIYDCNMNLILDDVTNGFLDLYEYFEYFEPNEPGGTV